MLQNLHRQAINTIHHLDSNVLFIRFSRNNIKQTLTHGEPANVITVPLFNADSIAILFFFRNTDDTL